MWGLLFLLMCQHFISLLECGAGHHRCLLALLFTKYYIIVIQYKLLSVDGQKWNKPKDETQGQGQKVSHWVVMPREKYTLNNGGINKIILHAQNTQACISIPCNHTII